MRFAFQKWQFCVLKWCVLRCKMVRFAKRHSDSLIFLNRCIYVLSAQCCFIVTDKRKGRLQKESMFVHNRIMVNLGLIRLLNHISDSYHSMVNACLFAKSTVLEITPNCFGFFTEEFYWICISYMEWFLDVTVWFSFIKSQKHFSSTTFLYREITWYKNSMAVRRVVRQA